jgi:hypothetical protein
MTKSQRPCRLRPKNQKILSNSRSGCDPTPIPFSAKSRNNGILLVFGELFDKSLKDKQCVKNRPWDGSQLC